MTSQIYLSPGERGIRPVRTWRGDLRKWPVSQNLPMIVRRARIALGEDRAVLEEFGTPGRERLTARGRS